MSLTTSGFMGLGGCARPGAMAPPMLTLIGFASAFAIAASTSSPSPSTPPTRSFVLAHPSSSVSSGSTASWSATRCVPTTDPTKRLALVPPYRYSTSNPTQPPLLGTVTNPGPAGAGTSLNGPTRWHILPLPTMSTPTRPPISSRFSVASAAGTSASFGFFGSGSSHGWNSTTMSLGP